MSVIGKYIRAGAAVSCAALFPCLPSGCAAADGADKGEGKKVYPLEWMKNMDLDDPDSPYAWERSMRSENFLLMWEKGFGDDPRTAPDLDGHDMTCDPSHVLAKAEEFYAYYRDTLKFLDKGSLAEDYVMMCMLGYSLDDTAIGGVIEDKIGIMLVTPSRLRDGKLNCIAHELGHSFQYQLSRDIDSGFNGDAAHEMTSQWMLWQVNPDWMRDEEYHWHDFMRQTHLAFGDPANMYHSPYVMEFWSQRYGKTFIGRLWREAHHFMDMVDVYRRMQGMDQMGFCDEMFEACRRFITYDLDRVREYAAPYANRHECKLMDIGGGWYRIAFERTPRQYGYNGIRLAVPEAGSTVRVHLEGMADSDNPNYYGWRFGMVGVRKDGSVIYPPASRAGLSEHNAFSPVSEGLTGYAAFTVPEDEELAYLWLVVMAAPDFHITDYDTVFPYRFRVTGSRPVCDIEVLDAARAE